MDKSCMLDGVKALKKMKKVLLADHQSLVWKSRSKALNHRCKGVRKPAEISRGYVARTGRVRVLGRWMFDLAVGCGVVQKLHYEACKLSESFFKFVLAIFSRKKLV